ncbi:hypothetical protein, partial [Lysobacter antibioticus]|uniref:hypothetical protein n=1 Tax=Lysobacter antibioticus TaxID=84531 RepID=UPI001647FF8A
AGRRRTPAPRRRFAFSADRAARCRAAAFSRAVCVIGDGRTDDDALAHRPTVSFTPPIARSRRCGRAAAQQGL